MPANTNPVSIRTRWATNVPVERSDDTARQERVSPHPPHKGIEIILTSSSDEEDTPFQPGGETTTAEEEGGRTILNDDIQRGSGHKTETVHQRFHREECSDCTPDSSGQDIIQSDRQLEVAIRRNLNISQSRNTPPARLPSLSPITRGTLARYLHSSRPRHRYRPHSLRAR